MVLGDGTKCWKTKAYTQPENLGAGVLEGLENAARLLGQPLQTVMQGVVRFGLGTTAVTNVLATKGGRRVGFITTRGFEGHLIAARGKRSFNDGWSHIPWAPVEESCVAGIGERIDPSGAIVRPLSETELLEAATRLVEEEQVEAFAVSFIWSSRNPQHEQAAVEFLEENFPSLPVFSGERALSSGLARTSRHKSLDGLVLAGRHMLTQHDANVMESLNSIEKPTLIIVGARDKPFLNGSDYMARKIPGARKVVIPDAGHAANVDQPDEFNRAVLAFLSEHGL